MLCINLVDRSHLRLIYVTPKICSKVLKRDHSNVADNVLIYIGHWPEWVGLGNGLYPSTWEKFVRGDCFMSV